MERDWELERRFAATVRTLHDAGGSASEQETVRLVARELGISVSEMPFVVNSAIAEGIVIRDTDRNMLWLPQAAARDDQFRRDGISGWEPTKKQRRQLKTAALHLHRARAAIDRADIPQARPYGLDQDLLAFYQAKEAIEEGEGLLLGGTMLMDGELAPRADLVLNADDFMWPTSIPRMLRTESDDTSRR
ncbi:hypothetical protein ACFVAJ_17885 [Agromyces sp. NPDC057679]|uniref:hypothetical protein n=1 Tax=Agromyces sp. NPDC057679 TaxID=3346207 RepID=UPI00366D1A93